MFVHNFFFLKADRVKFEIFSVIPQNLTHYQSKVISKFPQIPF
jgi:hypothetical protein